MTIDGAGISDLVLELRYNGGGLLDIASELAYMVAGSGATAGKTFERTSYNNKNTFGQSEADASIPFHNRMLQISILPCLCRWLIQVNVKKPRCADSQPHQLLGIKTMKLLTDLFTTDYGLMSIIGIAFMLGMGVFFIRLFYRKMDEDGRAAGLKR